VGGVKSLKSLRGRRQASQLPKFPRTYIRSQTQTVLRDRRRKPIAFGVDELEMRAAPKEGALYNATLPERIIYKKLQEILRGTSQFIFQRVERGGRNLIGGYVIDFLIIDRTPFIALEILGNYWHQAYEKQSDLERSLAVQRAGYAYHEIWERDIYISDEYVENFLLNILGQKLPN
tara:strand:- start:73 stop:600 length:528 start_codon:yes stop_codon:yes gene_type:complete